MKRLLLVVALLLSASTAYGQKVIVDEIPGVIDSTFPEAPVDGKTYGRQNQDWSEVTGAFPEAPLDGQQYGRQSGAWTQVVTDVVDESCDYNIDLDDGGTLGDVQDAINTWNVFSDVDGDGKNDKLRVCVSGTTTINGSEARTSYVQNGATVNDSLVGGSKFYLKVNGVNEALTGCGIRDGSPIACATPNMQDNLHRKPQKSLPLYLYFEDVVVFADRDNWAATDLPIVFLQVGDGYHSGGMQFTTGSTGYNLVSDVVSIGGALSILTKGDGDGFPDLHDTPIPPRFGTDQLLADDTSFVGLMYDMATRIYDQGFVYTFRWSPPSVSSQGNKDESTIAFFNRHTWSHGNFMSSIQNVGVSALFQSIANVQTFQGYRGEFRAGRLGFVFGDPVYGCDTVYFADNAGTATQDYYPCGGVKIDATYEGAQNVVFGNVSNLELRGYSEGNQTSPNAHQWNVAAGANSVTGELCMSQAEAETQSTGSACTTPFANGGLSLAPVAGLNSTGANFGTLLLEGSMGGQNSFNGKDWYTIAVGNVPDGLFLRFGDNFSGPGNNDPAQPSLKVQFVCVSDDDCPGMVTMYGENLLGVGRWGNGIPADYDGEWVSTGRTTVREDCSTWTWTQTRAPGEYGDICIETDAAQSTATLYACLGMDATTGYCRDGDLVQVSGSGGGGTDPQTAVNTADIATNTAQIATNAGAIGAVIVMAQDNTEDITTNAGAIGVALTQNVTQDQEITAIEADIATIQSEQTTQDTSITTNAGAIGAFGTIANNNATSIFNIEQVATFSGSDITLTQAGGQIVTTPALTQSDCVFLSESGDNGGLHGASLCASNDNFTGNFAFTLTNQGKITTPSGTVAVLSDIPDVSTFQTAGDVSSAIAGAGHITDAPVDGSEYVRLDGGWAVATGGGSEVLRFVGTFGIPGSFTNTAAFLDLTSVDYLTADQTDIIPNVGSEQTLLMNGTYKVTITNNIYPVATSASDDATEGSPLARGEVTFEFSDIISQATRFIGSPLGFGAPGGSTNYGAAGAPTRGNVTFARGETKTVIVEVASPVPFGGYIRTSGHTIAGVTQDDFTWGGTATVVVEKID